MKIAAKYGVERVYIFGSVARGETSESSDVDLLIEMKAKASALGVGGFQYEAQNLLGTQVDVVPSFALKSAADKQFVQALEEQAIPL